MANDTTLTITGNLTDDPDLRYTPAGVAMARFTVASTPRIRDRESGEYRDGEALFLTCTAWRELAEHAAESLSKGARVVVVGRLRLSRWETDEGERRSAYGLDVDEVGPSLRFAVAKVAKMTRRTGHPDEPPPDDLWTQSTPQRQTEPAVPAAALRAVS